MKGIDMCEKILDPDIYTLKGKTIPTKTKSVVNDYIYITQEIKDTHQNIELCAYIVYIQGQMFLVAISKRIICIAIQDIIDRNIPILNKAFDNTFRV